MASHQCGADTPLHPELGVDASDVVLNRPHAENQFGGDVLVVASVGNEA
jgi:hypothetical protein